MMDLSVSLPEFVRSLETAKDFDARYPRFDQMGWLLDHWSFGNTTARYDALPMQPNRGAFWWHELT